MNERFPGSWLGLLLLAVVIGIGAYLVIGFVRLAVGS